MGRSREEIDMTSEWWEDEPDRDRKYGALCSEIRSELWKIFCAGDLTFDCVKNEITAASHISHNEIDVCKEMIFRNQSALSRGFVDENREIFSQLLGDYLQTCLDEYGYGSL